MRDSVESSTKTRTILALNANVVRKRFEEVGRAIAKAVDFLSTEFAIRSLDFLPHLQQVVGLTYFFHYSDTVNDTQRRALSRWFWSTSFSRRYSAQTDDKMNADIQFMDKLLSGDAPVSREYFLELDEATLLRQKFSKSNSYTRAFLLLLAQRYPQDLTNGSRIDLGEALSSYNRKEYHHIFPRAFLKNSGKSADRINTVCNFCFLPAGSNKKISQRKPSDYIFNLVPEQSRKAIFESNVMPLNLATYENDDYEDFLAKRASAVVQVIAALVV